MRIDQRSSAGHRLSKPRNEPVSSRLDAAEAGNWLILPKLPVPDAPKTPPAKKRKHPHPTEFSFGHRPPNLREIGRVKGRAVSFRLNFGDVHEYLP